MYASLNASSVIFRALHVHYLLVAVAGVYCDRVFRRIYYTIMVTVMCVRSVTYEYYDGTREVIAETRILFILLFFYFIILCTCAVR